MIGKTITYLGVWLFFMAACYSLGVLFCAFISWSAPAWDLGDWPWVARFLFGVAAIFWAICAWKAAAEEAA